MFRCNQLLSRTEYFYIHNRININIIFIHLWNRFTIYDLLLIWVQPYCVWPESYVNGLTGIN